MSSEGNKDISTEAVSMEQSSTAGAKRKRGRPRKYEHPSYELPPQMAQPIQSIPPPQSTQAQDNRSGRPRNSANLVNQVNSGKDDILGKRFIGKMTSKFPGFCLITVKVKDNQMLKGWIPDQNNLNPITPKDDLTTELPMLRPSKVQKKASAVPIQAAPLMPIHLEDVTHAKPLQMRRPVDKTIAKHAIQLTARPYMGSGAAVTTVPVSVSPSNVETGTLIKQDSECMVSQSPVAAVPITSVPPVSVAAKQMANQNDLMGQKSSNDSQSSNGARGSSVESEKPNAALVDVVVKDCQGETQLLNAQGTDEVGESSGKNQHVNTTKNEKDDIKIALGTTDQPNFASCDHQISKEPSEIVEKGDLLKTRTVDLKGDDESKLSGAPDDVHTVDDEHEMKDDGK